MDQVTQVREKIDIVALLSEYIPLKKTGANFKAPCPFHSEKSPSFVVSPERQIWHCFGCGKGGDVFTFLMDYEHVDFPEALRDLAKRAGITLEQKSWQAGSASKKEKIFAINSIASEFYHYILITHPAGKKALEYLINERGITMDLINTFMIGFAPTSGEALSNYLLEKKKQIREDLMEAGISIVRRGRVADFFINRIMFPLIEHRGDVIGFSGRIFDTSSPDVPKYINTRDTIVYHKGTHFFGLNLAKESIKKEAKALIVEGEFDVIACFKHGIRNAIAIKGTALTDQQASLLKRFTSNVALCLDQDNAGQIAVKRSTPVLEKKGLNTSVVIVPSGKDADEALKNGELAFKMAIKHDINVYDFLLGKAEEANSSASADGKQKISRDIIPFLVTIENEIVKEHYVRKLSRVLDTSYEAVIKEMNKIVKKENQQPFIIQSKEKKSRKENLEFYLLALLFQNTNIFKGINSIMDFFTEEIFDNSANAKIFSYLISYCKQSVLFDMNSFTQILPAELMDSFNAFFLFPLPPFLTEEKYEKEVIKSAKDIKLLYLRGKIQLIGREMRKKEIEGDLDGLKLLQDEFINLTNMLGEC